MDRYVKRLGPSKSQKPQKHDDKPPPGLIYIPEFIKREGEAELIKKIDSCLWNGDSNRRFQNYGYRCVYNQTTPEKIGDFPEFCKEIAERLDLDEIKLNPDHLIINEYQPGQGKSPNVDSASMFEDGIAVVSLGSNYTMSFKSQITGAVKTILLEKRSLLVMTGDSRYKWSNSISPKKLEKYKGRDWKRGRRISLTFRKIKQ
jgi:alkylated DNA repair dioxygenase AlkB